MTSDMTKRIIATNGYRHAIIYSKSYTKGQHMTAQSVPNCNPYYILHLPQFYHNYWFVSHTDERNLLHKTFMSPFYPNEPFWSNHHHKTNPEIPKIHKNSTSSGETTQRQYSEKESPKRNPRFPQKIFGGFSLPKPLYLFCGQKNPVLGRSRVHTDRAARTEAGLRRVEAFHTTDLHAGVGGWGAAGPLPGPYQPPLRKKG